MIILKRIFTLSRLDRMTGFFLGAMIFVLPLSKSMVEIFIVLSFLSWAAKRYVAYGMAYRGPGRSLKERISEFISAFKPVKTILNVPIAFFVFAGFLSTVTSVSLILSMEGFFFKLLEWVMVYFIVAETVSDEKRLAEILGLMFFSAVIIAIDGIFQQIKGVDFLRGYTVSGYRIQGPFGNPNSFAGWLLFMIPLTLSIAYFGRGTAVDIYKWTLAKVSKTMFWVLTILILACLVLTYTRGAWIALVLSLIFLGIFKSKKLLIPLIILLIVIPFVIPNTMKERILGIFYLGETEVRRHYVWREALGVIEDFPLLGSGLNTYTEVGHYYKIFEGGGYYPHNSYLHMAAESGIFGAGAFIWIIFTLFRISLSNLKKVSDRYYGTLLIGLLAGLLGFLAHSFVDTNIYTLQLGNMMWFVMGLIIAVQKICLRNE